MLEETSILLPLLQSPDREALLKEECLHNNLLRINAETSRKRAISEIARRYDAMPATFWRDWQDMSSHDRPVALFLVILKTYKILFDFHVNVTMRKWNSISKTVDFDHIQMEFNEIAGRDAFVDSWSEATRKKVGSVYLTILRKVGMLNAKQGLQPISCSNFHYYLTHGEAWFLEACLLAPYEIEKIRKGITL